MKKHILISLMMLALVFGAVGCVGGYLYKQGPSIQNMGYGISGKAVEKIKETYEAGFEIYKGAYLPGTTINGENVSGMTPEAYIAQTEAASRQGEFILNGKNGVTDVIQLTDIIGSVDFETPPEDFLSEDELALWPVSINKKREFEDAVTVTFDTDKITAAVKASVFMKGEGITDPEDAYFTKTDEGFEIVPEKEGTRIRAKHTIKLIKKALDEGKLTLDLVKENCYRTASITSDDANLKSLLDQGQKIQATVIKMDMTNAVETIDWSVFGPWINWNGTEFTLDEAAMKTYVEELSKTYWTYRTERDFVNHAGQTIKVGGGESDTYGFWLNVDNTTERLKNALTKWESQDILASWKTNALTRNQANGDIGGTYLEINLEEQHMWLYKNNSIIYESDVVSGTATDPERATPTGVFCILNMLPDHTMSGSYGTEFCHYFMAFTWTGCAVHDAPWRDEFGGTIYLEDGSHGCVNTPPTKMAELWNLVFVGMPVIVY